MKNGGETGIRTLGTLAGSTVFETAPFDHSGTSPQAIKQLHQIRLVRVVVEAGGPYTGHGMQTRGQIG